jgi:hypothetical protein
MARHPRPVHLSHLTARDWLNDAVRNNLQAIGLLISLQDDHARSEISKSRNALLERLDHLAESLRFSGYPEEARKVVEFRQTVTVADLTDAAAVKRLMSDYTARWPDTPPALPDDEPGR